MNRSIDRWLPGVVESAFKRPRRWAQPCHLLFCVADHFEPLEVIEREETAKGAEDQVGTREARLKVVDNWAAGYAAAGAAFRDADGKPPRHTFFCAANDYEGRWMSRLADLATAGRAEVELHLHHRHDTAEGLRGKLAGFRDTLRREHGLLGRWMNAERGTGNAEPLVAPSSAFRVPRSDVAYGFIHGNWALGNARPDGDWCGVNEELGVLAGTGCYADFTFPSAPSSTQPRIVNAIYRARDTGRPRAADGGDRCRVRGGERTTGLRDNGTTGPRRTEDGGRNESPNLASRSEAETRRSLGEGGPHPASRISDLGLASPPDQREGAGRSSSSSGLMLITGPLALDWRRRKWGVLPRLENGAITHHNPVTAARLDLWVRQHIHVAGRPEWVFVKVYCHGAIPSTSRLFLGGGMREAHARLGSRYNDGTAWQLHYVTAREMYNIARAAEDGRTGNPGEYRDYEITPPPCVG